MRKFNGSSFTRSWALVGAVGLIACGGPVDADSVPTSASEQAFRLPSMVPVVEGLRTNAVRADVDPDQVGATLNPVPLRDFVPPNLFCRGLGEAMCGNLDACGCAESKAACWRMVEQDCAGEGGILGPDVRRAIGADRVRYNGYAAHRFLHQIAEGAVSCMAPLQALEWTRRDFVEMGGVLRGTVPDGNPCSLPFGGFHADECETGICMLDMSGKGTCMGVRDVGETCSPKEVCFEMDRPATYREFVDGTFFARCVNEDKVSVCKSYLEVGMPCAGDEACRTGLCIEGICEARGAGGDACQRNLDCGAGYCERGVCTDAKLEVGAVCDGDWQCESNACLGTRCAEAICLD